VVKGTLSVQVVLLGAGMDTRPWRLPLPPGTLWLEVDQADVAAAKRKSLRAANAQTQVRAHTLGAVSAKFVEMRRIHPLTALSKYCTQQEMEGGRF
jgi:O-methyltransferase involved in polyketide biosynthesis